MTSRLVESAICIAVAEATFIKKRLSRQLESITLEIEKKLQNHKKPPKNKLILITHRGLRNTNGASFVMPTCTNRIIIHIGPFPTKRVV